MKTRDRDVAPCKVIKETGFDFLPVGMEPF